MAQKSIQVSENISAVKVKSYGNLKIYGKETDQIVARSKNDETLNLVLFENAVEVTTMQNCDLEIPKGLPVIVEKALGSVHAFNLEGLFSSEKILGNLVLDGAASIQVEKVGGNCAVRNIKDLAQIEKVGGQVIAENISKLQIEKMGGSCKIKSIHDRLSISKIGGSFDGENLTGQLEVLRVGGDFTCDQCNFGLSLKAGGDIKLRLTGSASSTSLLAGGDVHVYVDPNLTDITLTLLPGGDAELKVGTEHQRSENSPLEVILGNGEAKLETNGGGDVSVSDAEWTPMPGLGDLQHYFEEKEFDFNQVVHENVQRATSMAEKRIVEAQKRLEQIGKRLEDEFGDFHIPPKPPIPPIPPFPGVTPKQKKGVSDEERLLILQMLQDKKITVDEAERLFKTMEK